MILSRASRYGQIEGFLLDAPAGRQDGRRLPVTWRPGHKSRLNSRCASTSAARTRWPTDKRFAPSETNR